MDDHDQRLKTLLREFLPEFFELSFPAWAARFDFDGTEFLEQEAFLDPPHGEKRLLDVVAKIPTREAVSDPGGRAADHWLVIVHIEVESPDRAAEIRPRMWHYYDFLRRQHRLPVLPICLFLRVGLDGIGWTPTRSESGITCCCGSSIRTSACRRWTVRRMRAARTFSELRWRR